MSDQSSFPNNRMSESMRRILESMPETPPPPVPPAPPAPGQPGEFRQFIIYVAEIIALLFVVLGTLVPAVLTALTVNSYGGNSGLPVIIVGGLGFVVSTLISAGYLVLSDIAANTRETVKVLREIKTQGSSPAS